MLFVTPSRKNVPRLPLSQSIRIGAPSLLVRIRRRAHFRIVEVGSLTPVAMLELTIWVLAMIAPSPIPLYPA